MLSAELLFVLALQIVPPQFEGIAKSEGGASDRKGPAMALNSQPFNIRLLCQIATFFSWCGAFFLAMFGGPPENKNGRESPKCKDFLIISVFAR